MLHSRKSEPENGPQEKKFLLKINMFKFYVSFWGCICNLCIYSLYHQGRYKQRNITELCSNPQHDRCMSLRLGDSWRVFFQHGTFMASQPTPNLYTPPRNQGLIAGLIKGNQWLISPDHKAIVIRKHSSLKL